MMRTRVVAAVAAAALAAALTPIATPAGAVTGTVDVTCVHPDDPNSVPTHRSVSFAAHAPDSVAPGAQFSVETDIGYAVATTAFSGGIAIYAAIGGGQNIGSM